MTEEKKLDNASHYDPKRKTVGAMYIDAQKNTDNQLTIGDVAHELSNSLVDDLNATITSNPFDNRPFYIIIHEKKDLMMQNAILRRMLVSEKRPWPEDDTVVFHTDPDKNLTLFCWSLPHWTHMDNMLANPDLYSHEEIEPIKAWKSMDLHHFGFKKDDMGNWEANPHYKDKKLEKAKSKLIL